MKAVVFVNPTKEGAEAAALSVERLLSSEKCEVFTIHEPDELYVKCPEGCDFAVILGGDGTVLASADWASRTGTPVVGVDFGRVGYMNELSPKEIPLISRFFTGEYENDERMMLDVSVKRKGNVIFYTTVLNEAVIGRGTLTKLVDLELYCGGEKAASYRADGIIVATPTGSTAYSMSAGGPIVDPSLSLITVSAVCPHGFSGSSSLVFSPSSPLSVKASSKYKSELYLTADGRANFELCPGDTVDITKSATTLKIIRFKHNSFYQTLTKKFNER